MKFLTGIMFLMALLSSMPSHAGNDVGNGGNIVTCFNTQGQFKSIELLDFYEARTMRDIQTDLGPSNQSLDQVMTILLSRLAERNPTRAAHYQDWYSTFFKDAKLLSGIELIEIPDSHHVAVPVGCKVQQIVNQRNPEFPEDKRYTINKDLWDMLDGPGKAGLVLHELIYREAIEGGATESTTVRYLNSLLASNHFRNLSQFEYLRFQKRLFSNTDFLGSNISFGTMDDKGTSIEFIPADDVFLKTPSGVFRASKNLRVGVADNGNILYAELTVDTSFTLASGLVVSCWAGDYSSKTINFDQDSGRLSKCQLTPGQHLIDTNFDLTCATDASATFNSQGHYQGLETGWGDCKGKFYLGKNWIQAQSPNIYEGKIRGLALLQDQVFQIGNGKSYLFAKDYHVGFDDKGNVTSGELSHPETIKVRGTNLNVFSGVQFASDGSLLAANLNMPELDWNFAGQTLKIGGSFKCSPFGKKHEISDIEFYPNGEIQSAWLVHSSDITSERDPKPTHYPPGTKLFGKEDGKIDEVHNFRYCK
ncbi:MAG: hypothetical protein ACXVLQ_17755 [Bacteriovorax sp.]